MGHVLEFYESARAGEHRAEKPLQSSTGLCGYIVAVCADRPWQASQCLLQEARWPTTYLV